MARAGDMATPREPGPILWDVMQEHLEEAGFLWSQWERSLDAPDFTLPEVAAGDEQRLLAHLDGLVLGGAEVAAELLWPTVAEEQDPELVLAAALALLSGERGSQYGESVVQALGAAEDERRGGLLRALQLADLEAASATVAPLLAHPSPAARSAALELLAFHRVDRGAALIGHLQDPHPGVRAAALRAARVGRPGPVMALLASFLGDGDARVCAGALTTGLRAGLKSAWAACKEQSERADEAGARALLLLAVLGGPAQLTFHHRALEQQDSQAAALFALGISGRPEAVELCLPFLDADPRLSRLALEAIAAITGLDPTAGDMLLDADEHEPEEPLDLEDEDLDAEMVDGPEASLPVADPAAVRQWWADNRGRFMAGARHVAGIPINSQVMQYALLRGPMRRRHALALELELRSGGQVQIQTRTWGGNQLRLIGQISWPDDRAMAAPAEELLPW